MQSAERRHLSILFDETCLVRPLEMQKVEQVVVEEVPCRLAPYPRISCILTEELVLLLLNIMLLSSMLPINAVTAEMAITASSGSMVRACTHPIPRLSSQRLTPRGTWAVHFQSVCLFRHNCRCRLRDMTLILSSYFFLIYI